MQFTITSGKGLISIGLSDIGSYFRYDRPTSVAWHDCRGSVAKYLCVFPVKEGYRESLIKKINDSITGDFTNDTASLYHILEPILQLFENGEYHLKFSNSVDKDFFKYRTSRDNFSQEHVSSWSLEWPEATLKDNEEQKKEQFQQHLSEKPNSPLNIFDLTTYNYYDGGSVSLVATQPISELDLERVKYFEDKIRKGERPFAIIYRSYFQFQDEDWMSENYVIDGHHKLMAYSNLKIHPPIASVFKEYKDNNSVSFDFSALKNQLYSWQAEHLYKNWEGKNK